MFHHIKGKLTEINPTYAVVECNGIGYFLNISLHTYSQLKDSELAFFFTQLIVREDAHTLYGFATQLEKEVFKLLISVSGIGPNTARTMLSSMSTEEIQQAIASDNVAAIQSIKGIGAKTAQKVIIELKDKILKTYTLENISTAPIDNTIKSEALAALEVLGYLKKPAEKVLTTILKQHPEVTVEKLIKLALKNL